VADEPNEHDEKPEAADEEHESDSAKADEEAPADASPKGDAPKAAAKDDDEDEDDEEEDAASPEAIAKRVAALGEEDEIEKIARAEEKKLAERRAKMRKGKGKKSGLEAAASKRLAKIGAKAGAPKRTVATAVDADPLIEKTQQLTKWAKQNRRTVGTVLAAAAAVALAFGGYAYVQRKHEAAASEELAKAVADERGRIGDPDKAKDDDRPVDPTPIFKTVEARRDSALAKYRDVESKFPKTGAAYLARLGEGSLLLDKHEVDGAIAAFTDVKASPLADADSEVRGRALEGLGFAYELKAQAGDADKWRDEAAKAFRDLENTDVTGFKELGMYHQARVAEDKGDKTKAVELLKSVVERTTKPGEAHPFPYLAQVADERLRALDPTALPPKVGGPMGGGGPGGQMNDAQIKALIEQMKKRGGPPGAPPK